MSQSVEGHQKLFSEGFSGVDKRGNYGHVMHHMNGNLERENLTAHFMYYMIRFLVSSLKGL